jgi:DMSO/TMAO reductase YedYZ molybdopterin-dependent catalytic subunit
MCLKKLFFVKLLLIGIIFSAVFVTATIAVATETTGETKSLESVEIREYEGEDLSSIDDFRENSIKGPQYIDEETYRLAITGLVNNGLELTYDDVIGNFQHAKKVVTLHCVEGWSVTILWEGIFLEDLFEEVKVNPNATVVIFYAYDGYSTSIPLEYIIDHDIIMANKMNNVTLPPERGFPFQLVAETKWGYKWIKWITEIELSDNEDYLGYWESRGWPDVAEIPEFPKFVFLPLFMMATLLAVTVYKRRLKKV